MCQWFSGFVVGVLVGLVAGMIVTCLCAAASKSNKDDK